MFLTVTLNRILSDDLRMYCKIWITQDYLHCCDIEQCLYDVFLFCIKGEFNQANCQNTMKCS